MPTTRLRAAASALTFVLALSACHAGPKQGPGGASGPPVPTPVGVPIGSGSSTTIDPPGGVLQPTGGDITVTVPSGAVRSPVTLRAQEITNFAPNAVGAAYRLGPEGTTFALPVSITFSADLSAHDIDDLAIAYQDSSGYWIRPWDVVRDRAARTITVTTNHFSDWTLVTTPSGLDLGGSFQLTQTVALPFSATGNVTLSYAGENAYEAFYLVPGTITPTLPVPYGSTTCTTSTPTATLPVQLAERIKSPATLDWAIDAYWILTCADGSGNIISTQFDTAGINLIGCARSYNGTPIVGPARAQGSFTIDCGARGTVTASWDFQSSLCGTSCTPANPCDTGIWSCTTGTAVCVDTSTPVPDGTSCGTTAVCFQGTCGSCTVNVACTPANVCDAGLTSCTTGQQVCLDAGPDPNMNGTTCGVNQVCYGGACNPCAAGAACTPANVCDAGLTSCTTGQQVCLDAGPDPGMNGTTCGAGRTCNGGGCVASSAVTGTRLVTYWPDPPAVHSTLVASDVATAAISAVVPDGSGGLVTYVGSFVPAEGSFAIPNVPTGSYLLVLREATGLVRAIQASATSIDLGWDVAGRPDASYAVTSTPVTLDLSLGGLQPWVAGDAIEIASSNADLWDALATDSIVPSATSAILADDWFAGAGGPLHLLAPGDVLYVWQLHSATGPGTTYTYVAADPVAAVSTVTLSSGAANGPIQFPALASPASAGSILVDWSLSAFEQYLPAMSPSATLAASQHALRVGANPQQLTAPAPALDGAETPTLFRLEVPGGTAPSITFQSGSPLAPTPVPYGHALAPTLWQEWRGVSFSASVGYALGATTPATLAASIGQREPMSPAPPTPIAPALSPPSSPALNGADAFATSSGVGTTPVLSWAPPAHGTATNYLVEIFALGVSGSSTVATQVASVTTGSSPVRVPPGVLLMGGTYVARITAFAASFDPTRPYRTANVYAWASALTGAFTP